MVGVAGRPNASTASFTEPVLPTVGVAPGASAVTAPTLTVAAVPCGPRTSAFKTSEAAPRVGENLKAMVLSSEGHGVGPERDGPVGPELHGAGAILGGEVGDEVALVGAEGAGGDADAEDAVLAVVVDRH